jgi:bla regulator protein blaR1
MLMRMSSQGMKLNAQGTPIASLVHMISQQIGATVLDKTGLTWIYDFTLSFMPDMAIGDGPMMRPFSGVPSDGPQLQEPVGPSIFAAVQEQLGLRLVAHKEPVEVIAIEQIGQPTAN